MKILQKWEFEDLMKEFPDGGIVFAEYDTESDNMSPLMVTDGDFGAREVIPRDGGVYDFDWNIKEYQYDDFFVVLDNDDVLQMIQTLTSGIKVSLKGWFDE